MIHINLIQLMLRYIVSHALHAKEGQHAHQLRPFVESAVLKIHDHFVCGLRKEPYNSQFHICSSKVNMENMQRESLPDTEG